MHNKLLTILTTFMSLISVCIYFVEDKTSLSAVFLLLAITGYIYIAKGKFPIPHNNYFIIVLLQIMSLVPTVLISFKDSIFEFISRTLIITFFGLFVYNLYKNDKYKIFIKIFYKVAFAVGLYGFVQLMFLGDLIIGNKNTIGFLLVPYLIYIVSSCKTKYVKYLIYLMSLVVLYLTGSRSVLLGFILFPFLSQLSVVLGRHRISIFTILCGVYVSAIIIFWSIFSFASQEELHILLSGRETVWLAYIDSISNNLWLGSGATTADNIADITYGLNETVSVHNTILDIIWRTGFIGLFFYLYSLKRALNFPLKRKSISFDIFISGTIIQLFEIFTLGGISFMSLVFMFSIFGLYFGENGDENHEI
jgi:hypothetical protein